MLTIVEIKEILFDQRKHLFDKYNLKNLAIFGSYSRNESNESSDIDIMAEFSSQEGIELIDLGDELEIILKNRVDIVSKNGIKPKYYKYIEKDLIYV
jgi:predicted nucleotidyltransferase